MDCMWACFIFLSVISFIRQLSLITFSLIITNVINTQTYTFVVVVVVEEEPSSHYTLNFLFTALHLTTENHGQYSVHPVKS